MKTIAGILQQQDFSIHDLVVLLESTGDEMQLLLGKANQIKQSSVGSKVYLRGLIEFSNICNKDCFYCGIRKSSVDVNRYEATDDEILEACNFAFERGFGSVVLQSGEISSKVFTGRVETLIRQIKQLSDDKLGITLSCGEQSRETLIRWFESGAHRYLLRIEASNRKLYNKIHPQNLTHSYDRRVKALHDLKEVGYQVGTGVMIGLPFQTTEDLANDLLFFRELDIDMCGMGPYIEHEHTPLIEYKNLLLNKEERLDLSLKMIACLRILMPDINIAASTALQVINASGREQALNAGANILMPNITPCDYRKQYRLYDNKPDIEDAGLIINAPGDRAENIGYQIGYNEWGDSRHFFNRKKMTDVSD